MAGSDDTTTSAIPGDLINWSSWAGGLDTGLQGDARTLNQAIEALDLSKPWGLTITYDDYAGNQLLGYATRNSVTDQWVGQVGNAFLAAETKGMPPSMIAQYGDSLRNSLVTVDPSQLGSVGDDPTALAQDEADAAMMGEKLKEATDRGDGQTVKQLLSQIPAHQNDPNYTVTLFQDLGPGYTTQVVHFIDDANTNPADDQLLKAFDTALATATNSPNWDSGWNSQMWPARQGRTDPWFVTPDMALLLKYGTYSEDFLTRAGDLIMFSDPGNVNNPTYDNLFLNALSRNPTASLDYLLGKVNNDWYPGGIQSRIEILMMTRYVEYQQHPEVAHALGLAISSAGQSPDATVPWPGPFGTEPMYQIMLHEISGIPNRIIPDGARFGIANVLGQHIGDFTNVQQAHDGSWNWQETIFKDAEEGAQGNVIWGNVQTIQTSVAQWANAHIPTTPGILPATTASNEAWQSWSQQTGNLFGLSSLPIRTSGYDQAAIIQAQNQMFGTLFNFVPIPGGTLVSGMTNTMANYLMNNLNNAHTQLGADQNASNMYFQQAMQMRVDMTTQFLLAHPEPGMVAGTPAFTNEVSRIANETVTGPPNSDQVSQFINYLDNASRQFGQAYSTPTVN